MMLNDLERNPAIKNWASLLHNLLFSMGFKDVWLQQGVGNYNNFISVLSKDCLMYLFKIGIQE